MNMKSSEKVSYQVVHYDIVVIPHGLVDILPITDFMSREQRETILPVLFITLFSDVRRSLLLNSDFHCTF